MTKLLTVPLLLCALVITLAQTRSQTTLESSVPPNYWPLEKSQPIIDKTQTIRLAPDLSQLSADERKAVAKLLEVGKIFQGIYEDQRHKQALSAYRNLNALVRSYYFTGAGCVRKPADALSAESGTNRDDPRK